jgi:predicted membrane-bound spermidine synthase
MILPFLFLLFRIMDPASGLIHILFFLLTFLISALTGILFSLATALMKGDVLQVASGLYGSDLIGAALGALLVAALLFPLLGLINVALLIGTLNFLAALFIWLRRKRLADNFVS